jgi:hypothetical protein
MRSIKALMLLTIAFTVITFSSCKKDSGDDTLATSTITVDIDGKATVFTTNTFSLKGETSGVEFTNIQGDDKDGNGILLTINGTVTAGKTYLSTAAELEDKPNFLYTEGADLYLDVASIVQTLTVTKISANRIEGTFSGQVQTHQIGPDPVKVKSFTNGKFKVAIISN